MFTYNGMKKTKKKETITSTKYNTREKTTKPNSKKTIKTIEWNGMRVRKTKIKRNSRRINDGDGSGGGGGDGDDGASCIALCVVCTAPPSELVYLNDS